MPYYFSFYSIDHKVIFCIRIIALFQYSLPYSQISFPCCRRYSNLFGIVINKHKGDSYCNISGKSYSLLLSSLIFLLVITKRYSTYTLFTASVSKTVFVVLQIPNKNRIQLKHTQKRRQRTLEDEEDVEPLAFAQKDRLLFWRG